MVHNRIALFRAERGLTRKALAEAVDVNPQTIGFLERGDYSPSVELALRLAQVLGARVELLFSLDPFPALADQLGTSSPSESP
jgi:putative transcriptional regulator